jgi:hypothetical protein
MPYIQADFKATAESAGGVCGTTKTLGVDVNTKVGVDLSVQAAKKGEEANPFWKESLYVSLVHILLLCPLDETNPAISPMNGPYSLHA